MLKRARNLLVDLQEGNIVGTLPLGEVTLESFMKGLKFINEMRGMKTNEISQKLKSTDGSRTAHHLTNFNKKAVSALDCFKGFSEVLHKAPKNLAIQLKNTLVWKG